MLLKLYSLIVLGLDLIGLLCGILVSILSTMYRAVFPPAMKNLTGEVAMVVGAGRGVGKELAIQLSKLGVQVACVDKNQEMCEAATAQCPGGKSFLCDVTKKLDISTTVDAIRAAFGEITMVFHCCGVPSARVLIEETPEIEKALELSVTSYFWLLDSILPNMQRIGRGHIVALSSVAGFSGGLSRSGRISFSTAQFAVQGLAESLHNEFRLMNSNIIISLVHIYPFIVDSRMAGDIRLRIPSYFGTMPASEAAVKILNGVRRNYFEFSVPEYLLYLGLLLRILPKKACFLLRDLLDTGLDFA